LKYTLDVRREGRCRHKLAFNADYRYVYLALSSMIRTKREDGDWTQRFDAGLAEHLSR
jgi:hypothetical protein